MAELPQSEFIYIILGGSVSILLFTGGFAIFISIYQKRMIREQQRRRQTEIRHHQKMVQAQLESQEVERKRIAADLHDSLGSLLWGAKLNAAFIERSIPLKDESKIAYDELVITLDQSIDAVKRIAWELTPEAFHHAGLSKSVSTLCNRLNGRGVMVEYLESGEGLLWNDDRALLVYRIIQELISNSLKHAQAQTLHIHLQWSGKILSVIVRDDGIGFELDEQRSGVGWWNITQRANQLKAEIQIGESPIKKGVSIELKVPLLYEA
jgi:two-component system, NarL family, sensor kinase